MKKIFYIIVGLFTFSIGFWSYLSRPFVTPVSLCEISQNAGLYRSKQIEIKAYLDRVPTKDIEGNEYSISDFNSSCVTGADLELTDELKLQLQNDESLRNFINEFSEKRREDYEKRDDSGFYIAEIEIIGEISEQKKIGHYPIPFKIKANQIKQISPIKFLTNEELKKMTENIHQ